MSVDGSVGALPEEVAQFCAALDEEIAAVRSGGKRRRTALRDGRLVLREPVRFVYEFRVEADVVLREDTAVDLVIEGRPAVSGDVVSLRSGRLLVAIEEYAGDDILAAELQSDDSTLLSRLAERLHEVAGNAEKFHLATARKILRLGQRPVVRRATDVPPEVTERLNDEQRAAVELAVGSDALFVWGPPGTGKTSVVAGIVEAHYRAGRSVLLVSNTNAAVDTALLRLCDRLDGDPGLNDGHVLRHGAPVDQDLAMRFGDRVDIERVVARLGAAAEQRRADATEQVEQWTKTVDDLQRTIELHRAAAAAAETYIATEAAHVHATTAEREFRAKRTALGERQAATAAEHDRALAAGAVRRRLGKIRSPEVCAAELAAITAQIVATEEALTTANATIVARVADLERARSVRDAAAHAAVALPTDEAARRDLAVAQQEVRAWREALAEAQDELAGIRDRVHGSCRVVAATATRAYLAHLPRDTFDVVVIDEASMLLLPMAYFAAGLASQSVVVAGDFRQLPSIVTNEKSAVVAEWLAKDPFAKAGITAEVEQGRTQPYLVALRTQYRMRPDICAVVNEISYADSPLKTGRDDTPPANLPDVLSGRPLVLVDTSSLGPRTSFRAGTASRYNAMHGFVVAALARRLADAGFLPPSGARDDSLAVISPYAAQSRLHASMLSDALGRDGAAYASTVHRFQGSEKSVVVLDLTDAPGAGRLGKLLNGVTRSDQATRLLNVAVSRARDILVVVADVDHLRRAAPVEGTVVRLLDHLAKHADVLDPADLLAASGYGDLTTALEREEPSAPAAFDDLAFAAAFAADLDRARSSILIFSPFCTEHGLTLWSDRLRAAIGRGVRVRVVLRPYTNGDSTTQPGLAERIARLRGLGCVVDERDNMHEKVAIIDGVVLWHGSFNILSHRDTSESMLRITGAHAARELALQLRTRIAGRRTEIDLAAAENPSCQRCGGPTVYMRTTAGPAFRCNDSTCGADRPSASPRNGALAAAGQPCPNPSCGNGVLVVRHSRFGEFLGCDQWSVTECRGPKWRARVPG